MTAPRKMDLYMSEDLCQLSFTEKPGWQKVGYENIDSLDIAIAIFLYDDAPLADMLGVCFCSLANDHVWGSWRDAVPFPDGGWATYFIDLSSYHDDYCRTPGIYIFDLRERTHPSAPRSAPS